MGMFDSFYVEVDGRELELQSKRFECGLSVYRLGDFVAGCLPGVRVFFETLFLDGNGKPMYGAERESGLQKTVFIAMAERVFVDYQVLEGELAPMRFLPHCASCRHAGAIRPGCWPS